MKKRRLILLLMALLLAGGGYAQRTKEALQAEIKSLQKDIETANKLLKETSKNKEVTLNQVSLMDKKIKDRQKLINAYNEQIKELDKSIKKGENNIKKLNGELNTLHNEYSKMVVFAYRNRDRYNQLEYLFSSAERTIDYPNEEKVLIDSPSVATFDMRPEMSANEITAALLKRIGKFDAIMLNFANGDMVGHTGNEAATVRAMECLDGQLSQIVPAVLSVGGKMLIIADHGNAEKMWDDKSNAPWTAHTNNKVRAILVSEPPYKKIKNGGLADVAPTILKLLGVKQPADMTGKSLV